MVFGNAWIQKNKENLEKFLKEENSFEKKILITGGTGFIGYHLAKKCVRMGWK